MTTSWELPKVLLRQVPEAAPHIAGLAVDAFDIEVEHDDLPSPPTRHLHSVPREPNSLVEMALSQPPSPAEQANDARVATSMGLDLGPYSLIPYAFVHPILIPALDADPLDAELLQRCADFIETALTAEPFVAEAALIMIVESQLTMDRMKTVWPFAGPALREAIRDDLAHERTTPGFLEDE